MREEKPIIIGMLEGTYEKTCRVFDVGGVCPSLESRDYKDPIKILGNYNDSGHDASRVVDVNGIAPTVRENHGTITAIVEDTMEVKDLGYMDNGTGKHQSNTVFDTNGIAPSVTTIDGGTQQIKIMEETICLNSKGGRGGVEGLQPSVQDRVYDTNGCSTSITTAYMPMILEEPREKKIGNIYGATGGNFAGNVYDKDNMAPTISTCGGGNQQPMIVDDTYENREPRSYDEVSPSIRAEREGFKVVAMRGRNPDNPSDRRAGIDLEQTLEPNEDNVCNTLTSVYKDNMIVEEQARYRIRKLTAKECFRLMSFTDDEYEKAASVNSQSQLYKQAGNSIVVDVLAMLFQEIINSDGTVNTHSGEQLDLFGLFSGE